MNPANELHPLVEKLLGDWDKHQEAHRRLEEELVEHRTRLENGVKVFSDIHEKLVELTPKPLSIRQILFPTIGVVAMVLSGWWGLGQMFADRPTEDRVESIVKAHAESNGHPGLAADLKELQREQVEQRRILDKMSATQEAMLDTIRRGHR